MNENRAKRKGAWVGKEARDMIGGEEAITSTQTDKGDVVREERRRRIICRQKGEERE